jgi:hypothetical protein
LAKPTACPVCDEARDPVAPGKGLEFFSSLSRGFPPRSLSSPSVLPRRLLFSLMKLVRYEAAKRAVAEAHRVDEVKVIRDKAQALAVYAKQAKDSDMIAWATEIKVRAERKAGQLLDDTKKNKQRQSGHGDQKSGSQNATPKLADLGVNKSQSSRWQKLAEIPDEQFEKSIAIAKELVGEVTTASLLTQAQSSNKNNKRIKVFEVHLFSCSGGQTARLTASFLLSAFSRKLF